MTARKPQTIDKSINVTDSMPNDDRSQALIHLADAARAQAEALTAIANAILCDAQHRNPQAKD